MNNKTFKKKGIGAASLVLAAAISLTGCGTMKTLSTNTHDNVDTIDTSVSDELKEGLTQIVDVPNNDFKLQIKYLCNLEDEEKWTITSDKSLGMEIKTIGLDPNVKIYIDNIHTDTSVVSYYPTIDGVIQDTMDDRIHNSLMLGFPISDNNSYYGINEIEGQNETFISGYVGGYMGCVSGSIEEKRRTEAEYLRSGVYGNKISSIIDLLIVKDGEIQASSVKSEIIISCWPFSKHSYNNEFIYKYYYYNEETNNMNVDELDSQEYEEKVKTLSKKNH